MEHLVREPDPWHLPGRNNTRLPISRTPDAHHQAVLLEVDVTRARREIRVRNRGAHDTTSFLAWVVSAIAGTLANSSVSKSEEVKTGGPPRTDVTLLLPRMVGSQSAVFALTVAHANRKSVTCIASIIEAARSTPIEAAEYVTGRTNGLRHWLFTRLPRFVRQKRLSRAIDRNRVPGPVVGDVVISASGMGGRARGWFIPSTANPVCVGIGAVAPRGMVLNGSIQQRDVFHMSVVIDSQAVSGDSASRWISSLLRSMESARELNLN